MSAPLNLDQFDGFTPGPWIASCGDLMVESEEGGICEVWPHDICDEEGEREPAESDARAVSNLDLLAAAPALLAECRRQREEIARLWRIIHQANNDLEDGHADYAFAIVQQVIHKEEAARAALASCERSEPAASEGEGA